MREMRRTEVRVVYAMAILTWHRTAPGNRGTHLEEKKEEKDEEER